jgi:WD40 repeat protein
LDSGIFIYSVDRPSKVLKFPLAHQNGVTAIGWASYGDGGSTLVSGGADGAIKKWSVSFG